MTVTITLTYDNPASAAEALAKLAAPCAIAHADRPDVGAPAPSVPDLAPPAPAPDLAAIFGGAGVLPPPPPALSTAAAAVLPTVPVALPGISLPPPPAATALVLPPAPPEAAPVDSAPPESPAGDGMARDSAGLPWDARIHAKTRTTNKDGTWRSKLGIDPLLKMQIENETRAALGLPVPGVTVTVTPAPPPAAAPTGETFAQFMVRVAPAFSTDAAGAQARMAAALQAAGLTALGQLSVRPDLVPAVSAAFEAAP